VDVKLLAKHVSVLIANVLENLNQNQMIVLERINQPPITLIIVVEKVKEHNLVGIMVVHVVLLVNVNLENVSVPVEICKKST